MLPLPSIYLAAVRTFTTSSVAGSRLYNPKISMTVAKNAKKHLARMAWKEEQRMKKRERGGPEPRTSPKYPLVHETHKTKVFNRQFKENIGQVLLGFPALFGKGITITRVNARPDFSEVLVFWVSRPSEEESVTQLLGEYVKEIRKGMIEDAGLGQLPKLTFVIDSLYLREAHLANLYRGLDLGPDAGTVQDENRVWEELEDLHLETDELGVMRELIMAKLNLRKTKKLAEHRYSGSTVEDYNELYRQSIEMDHGERKTFMKDNISKFLKQRNKMNVYANTIGREEIIGKDTSVR